MKITCPGCSKESTIVADEIPASFTCDCSHCDLLLLVENGVAFDFHKKLHERDERWPEDGKGTFVAEF